MQFMKLENWSCSDETIGLQFFVQRFDELTFEYTLDSHRASTMNAPSLVRESLRVIETYEKTGFGENAIQYVLDETQGRLTSNSVVSTLIGPDISFYLPLRASSLESTKKNLRLIRGELGSDVYMGECCKQLEVAIRDCKKSRIDFLANELATLLIGIGYSGASLNAELRRFFYGEVAVKDLGCLQDFFQVLFPEMHKFDVYLRVDEKYARMHKEILGALRASTVRKVPKKIEDEVEYPFPSGSGVAFFKDIPAFDAQSAIDVCRKNLERVKDLCGLFFHKEKFEIFDEAIARKKCCEKNIYSSNKSTNRMQFVRDNRAGVATKKLLTMMDGVRLPQGPDQERFFRVIEFHGMAARADNPENQLVNLWTALETLCPSKDGTSAAKSVVRAAKPALGLVYIRRLFLNLMQDIRRWDQKALQTALTKSNLPNSMDIVEKVFMLVTSRDLEDVCLQMLASMGEFELLKYRIFQLNKKFGSQAKIMMTVNDHLSRVEWHLHRIYRSRNEIVHTGMRNRKSSMMVVNAHDYFDQIFEHISLVCSGPQGFQTFEDAFSYTQICFEEYIAKLSGFDSDEGVGAEIALWKLKRNKSLEIFGVEDDRT